MTPNLLLAYINHKNAPTMNLYSNFMQKMKGIPLPSHKPPLLIMP